MSEPGRRRNTPRSPRASGRGRAATPRVDPRRRRQAHRLGLRHHHRPDADGNPGRCPARGDPRRRSAAPDLPGRDRRQPPRPTRGPEDDREARAVLAARRGKKRSPPVERRIEPHDPDNADAALLILGIATRGARDGSAAARALGGAGGAAAPPGRRTPLEEERLRNRTLHPRSRFVAMATGHRRMTDAPDKEQAVGYRRPPASSRFRKGQSGNPRGRPRGRHNQAPYEAVLAQRVTIREDGIERRVSAAEAFLLHMSKKGLEGDGAAARATMAAIAEARASRLVREPMECVSSSGSSSGQGASPARSSHCEWAASSTVTAKRRE